MTTEDIYEVLTSLGYQLQDRGSYWQTNALFRQGDNKTAIQIYKDTGVWRDYVNNTPPLRFERLVEKSTGKDNIQVKKLLENKDAHSLLYKNTASPKLTMETVYSEDSLKKLLPHYRFYNDRGIKDAVLKNLGGGLATQGQLYQRFVFPIYNKLGQIHGFSGRDMLNKDNRPKWKHIGRKSSWIYPAHIPHDKDLFSLGVQESEDIILVESIGDLLSLHSRGYYNVLVTFGLDVSPALITFLVGLGFSKVILSLNNDLESPENRGLDASVKNFLKLCSYFDYEKIRICLPVSNDFGEMNDEGFKLWASKLDSLKSCAQIDSIIKEGFRLHSEQKLSKRLTKSLSLLKKSIDA